MKTIVYMVRHAESPYSDGNERTRGLTLKGKIDSERVTEILKNEGIDIIVSSPYARAILTVKGLADQLNLEILSFEDLRERHFSADDYVISDDTFMPAIEKMFANPHYALPGGESNYICQNRATDVLNRILETYQGQKIAIGTHGNVMTLMMNYFDSKYGLDFFKGTSKPDIYRMEFNNHDLVEVNRLWTE